MYVGLRAIHFNKNRGYEFIGILPERRENPIRITKDLMSSGKSLLGDNVDSREHVFQAGSNRQALR